MRSSVLGMATAAPFVEILPAYLQEDEFAVRWAAGLDDVLAPVLSVLDCLDAYVDPMLTADDFVGWLAGWVGAVLDEHWAPQRRRAAVAAAVPLHGARGTLHGLRADLEVATGGRVEITESGGVTYSTAPTTGFPGRTDVPLHIRIHVARPEDLQLGALERLVDAAKPAHLAHTIEVVPDDRLP